MMNPYETLSVPRPATDSDIRRAYLKLIQEFPPDRDPERFKQISDAYEKIKDLGARINYLIFNQEMTAKTHGEVLVEYCQNFSRGDLNLEPKTIKEYLQSCAKKIYSKK